MKLCQKTSVNGKKITLLRSKVGPIENVHIHLLCAETTSGSPASFSEQVPFQIFLLEKILILPL